MPLLVVGSVAYDTVQTPTAVRERVIGGSATYFSYAASYFTPVRLVGVVGEDWDDANTKLLQARGIDTSGLTVVPGAKTEDRERRVLFVAQGRRLRRLPALP